MLEDSSSFEVAHKKSSDREVYRSFWDKYSDRADVSSMMLNADADELDILDRVDILASLPDFRGKDVMDIGAGIGFTTVFAESAKRVISTDFIESFIEKNKERNSVFSNVDYHVSDAIGLDFPSESTDFIFTNWLLMYLGHEEAIQLVQKALQWLRPGGHMHIRESCSGPSTKRSTAETTPAVNSLHQFGTVNPTQYRFSSAYILLFKHLRFVDPETSSIWRFEIKWACSVPAYIQRLLNWRQIHWLLRKVPAEEEFNISLSQLTQKFGEEWPAEQLEHDEILDKYDETPSIVNTVLEEALQNHSFGLESVIFALTPRQRSLALRIDSHSLASKFNCRVWNVETNPFCYRHSLTRANRIGNLGVRFAWNESINDALDFWLEMPGEKARFDAIVATELLSVIESEETCEKLKEISKESSTLVSLECLERGNPSDRDKFNTALSLLRTFGDVEVIPQHGRIDEDDNISQKQQNECDASRRRFEWLLVKVKFHHSPAALWKKEAIPDGNDERVNSGF